MGITELPPFTPRLEDYRAEEFLAHTLALLEFPIQLDQHALDMAPFQVKEPPRPPEPSLPLLPHVWYPKATREVVQYAAHWMTPPRAPFFVGGAAQDMAERVMRPLLAGQGSMQVQAATGLGRTTLLAHIANHARTKQRFRHIWWFDDAYRVGQGAAIAMDLSQVLQAADPITQLQVLAPSLRDDTLLIVDNLYTDHPLLGALQALSPYVLMAVETAPEVFEYDDTGAPIIPPDPPNCVTLRAWPDDDAIELLAEVGQLKGRKGIARETRPILAQIVQALHWHPLAVTLAGQMLLADDVAPEQLMEWLADFPEAIIQMSLEALPTEYRSLLESFSAFSPLGVHSEALQSILQYRDVLALQRGLAVLAQRGLIRKDVRFNDTYHVPALIYRMVQDPHQPGMTLGSRAREWTISYAENYRYDAAALFAGEAHLRHLYDVAYQHQQGDVVVKLNKALSHYLRTYMPAFVPQDADPPRLIGERADAMKQARQGLEMAESGDFEQGRVLISQAVKTLQEHGSDHDQAEVLVMLGRLDDMRTEHGLAAQHLEQAAKLVFDLGAEGSLSIVRLGLAMTYRHMGRLRDALEVLDDEPATHAERASIYRLMGNMEAMTQALAQSGTLTPYAKAESYMEARQYAAALQSIANDHSPGSHHLRAMIYHIQGDYEAAHRGYLQALNHYPYNDPERAASFRAIASIHALQADYESAEEMLSQALDGLRQAPDPLQRGRTLALLAAIYLASGQNRAAAETATQALQDLQTTNHHHDIAEAYQILARANWRLERHTEARQAFYQETEHAQSAEHRNESQIGQAFFHLAEAYRETGELDRAVANHRRALSHLDMEEEALTYFIVLVALYRTLFDMNRHHDALEASVAALTHLNQNPPPDLQYLGYMLAQNVRVRQVLDQHDDAYRSFSRWLTALSGRADALSDETRPLLALLALSLATRSLMAHNRPTDALPIAAEAHQIADAHIPTHPAGWAARRDYAEVLLANADAHNAYEICQPLLNDVQIRDEPHTYAALYETAGQAQHMLGDYHKALDYFFTALDHQPIRHKQGLIFEHAAGSYLALGDTAKAIENFNEAMKFLDRQAFPGDAARVLTTMAHTLAGVNRYGDAIRVYEDALEMLRAMPDASPIHTSRVYVRLGGSNEVQGQMRDAARAYQSALDILEQNRVKAPDEHRGIVLQLARVLIALEEFDQSIQRFEQARDAANDWGTQQEVGNITRELAEAQREAGYLNDALQSYADGLEMLPVAFANDRAAMLRSYGRALARAARFEEARSAWSEALKITDQTDPLEISLTYHAIGQAFYAQREYQPAAEAFRRALDNFPSESVEKAATHRELGQTLLDNKQPTDALEQLQAALDIEKTQPQQSNARLVRTLQAMGQAEEDRGSPEEAIRRYHASLVYMDRQFQPAQYAETLRTLGRLYNGQENWDNSQKALAEALDIELSQSPRAEQRLAETFRLIADAYLAEGQLEKAANAYKKMAAYTNLSAEDTNRLRSTLNDIDRYKETLAAGLDSLELLKRTKSSPKDFAYVYALVVRMHYLLSEMEQSRAAMEKLLKLLTDHAADFDESDERPEYRSLGHLRLAFQYEAKQDKARARDHYRAALKDNNDTAMGWLIERGLEAVM